MEIFGVLLGLGIILFFIIALVLALVRATHADRTASESEKRAADLANRIRTLENEIQKLIKTELPGISSRVHGLEWQVRDLRAEERGTAEGREQPAPAEAAVPRPTPEQPAPPAVRLDAIRVDEPTAPRPPENVAVPPPPAGRPAQPVPVAKADVPAPPISARPEAHVTPAAESAAPSVRAMAPAPVAARPRVPPAVAARTSAPMVEKPKASRNLEELLGANLFTKLGVTLLVIGMTFLLMTQWHRFSPGLKVTIGFLTAALMLVPGIIFEKRERWRILSRAGIGGGWALAFFVTYAMHHIAASRIIASESVDLVLMLIVAAAMVAHTLKYRSQVVTGLAFILAFTTVTISNVTANSLGPSSSLTAYSLGASAILALGLVAIVWRMGWYELEIFGILATFLNHYYWLRPIIARVGMHHYFEEYAASSALLIFYWLLFRVSYVMRKVKEPGEERISTVAALLNVGLFLGIMGYQAVHPPHPFWFFFTVGAVELAFGQLPWARRRHAAFVLLTTLGAVLLVTSFPYKFSGASLSLIWLADAEAFFLVGVFLHDIVFRRLGLLAGLLAASQILVATTQQVNLLRDVAQSSIGIPHLGLVYGAAALAFYLNAQFAPRRWPGVNQSRFDEICQRVTSYLATVLAAFGLWAATPEKWTVVAWAGLILVLIWTSARLKARDLAIQAHLLLFLTFVVTIGINLTTQPFHHHLGVRLITVVAVAALFYASSRWADGWAAQLPRRFAWAYTSAASVLVAGLIWFELPAEYGGPGLIVLALALAVAGNLLKLGDLSYQSYITAALSIWTATQIDLPTPLHVHGISLRLLTAGFVAAMLYVCARWAHVSRVAGATAIAEAHTWAATTLGAVLAYYECPKQWTPVAWCAMALALVWLGARIKRRDLAWQGHVLGFAAFAWLLAVNLGTSGIGHHIPLRLATVAICIVMFYLCSPGAARLESARGLRVPEGYTWIASTLVALLAWYELRPVSVAVAWMVFGLVLFELGFLRRSASLRLQGYVALASSFARIFFVNLAAAGEPGQISPRVWTVVPLALAFFYVFWRTRGQPDASFDLDRRLRVAEIHCFFGTIAFAALMRAELDAQWVVAGWAAMIVLLLALARQWKLKIFLLQGILLGAAVLGRGVLYNFLEHSHFASGIWSSRPAAVGVTVGLLFISLAFAFPLRSRREDLEGEAGEIQRALTAFVRRPEQFFFFLAVLLLTILLTLDLRSGMVTLAWGAEAVGIFLLALAVGERSFRLTGLSLLLLCVGKIAFVDVWELHGTDRYLTLIGLGIALLLVSGLYTRYREAIHRYL
jgi:uncharacterized membrane protein